MEIMHDLTRRCFTQGLLGVALSPTLTGVSRASDWPTQTIKFIVPASPASSTDLAARVFAERLSESWGRACIVENRPGANGVLAVKSVLQQQDSHTFLFGPAGVVTITPLLTKQPQFDVAALEPISLGALDYLAIATSPAASQATSLSKLVAEAKQKPGSLNVAAGLGGPHLILKNFIHERGLDVVHVPYRSPPEALTDLVAGRIHVVAGPVAPLLGFAKQKFATVLAITNPQRAPLLADVPTAAEQGFHELTLEGSLGFFGSRSLSAAVRDRIAADVKVVCAEPAIRARLAAVSVVPHAEDPDTFGARLVSQRAHWASVANKIGFRPPA
jgi:tripartite-type tricarboxylate transporter receptor subunit TctC